MPKTIPIRITFFEECLGTASANKDLHGEYVSSKAPDAPSMEEEIAALGTEEVERKGMSVFARDTDGRPMLWDYQLKGLFKDACSMLARVKGTKSSQLKAFKKVIDGLIFPEPRRLRVLYNSTEVGDCQRPLRVNGPQGERVAIAHSESVPAGSTIEVDIVLLDEGLEATVEEWLDYGRLRGLGQWRNSGKGRFRWERRATAASA